MPIKRMTPQEIAELMDYVDRNPQAAIQFMPTDTVDEAWQAATTPLWNFHDYRYRIAPVQRRAWIRCSGDSVLEVAMNPSEPPSPASIAARGWREFIEVMEPAAE